MIDFCPECGRSLKGVDPEGEGMYHWGVAYKHVKSIPSKDAQERYKILMEGE